MDGITLKTMLNVTKYDIEIAEAQIKDNPSDENPESFGYWVGFKAAKQQDLNRLQRLTEETLVVETP